MGTGGADDVDFDFATAAQFDGGTVTITVPSPAGIESVTLNGDTENLVSGEAEFALTNADLATFGAAQNVVLNANTTTPAAIANQTVSAAVAIDVATGSDLTIDGDNDDLGELTREGSNTGTFEWVGDANASTANVFRAVGLGTTIPTIRVTLSNSSGDMDGEYVLTPSRSVSNGELILTNADVANAAGGSFGRADVAFSFEAAGITVRRFAVANGVLTEMSTDYAVGADEIGG